jgi:hypothetical protein
MLRENVENIFVNTSILLLRVPYHLDGAAFDGRGPPQKSVRERYEIERKPRRP